MYECTYHYDPATASSTVPLVASSTCVASTTPIATTSDIVILPTFSAGEVLISFFLFAMILMVLASWVMQALGMVKTKKRVLAYSGGDVEIRDDV